MPVGLPLITIDTVKIKDTAGNTLTSTSGALDVNVGSSISSLPLPTGAVSAIVYFLLALVD